MDASLHAAAGAPWGGLRVGPLALALPLAALQEVQPCRGLLPLPGRAPALLGALPWRGALVPVADLRMVLGTQVGTPDAPGASAATATDEGCIVLLVHAGRMLGLRADAVDGIFGLVDGSLHLAGTGALAHEAPPDATTAPADMAAKARLAPTLFAGSARRADHGALVCVLSPAVLTSLPQLPTIEDPLRRQTRTQPMASAQCAAPADAAPAQPLLFLRCGARHLAIDALAVHATVADPRLQPSVMSDARCLGVIELAGQLLPAVDLARLCGLGAQAVQDCRHAFLVQRPEGRVAFLVGEVCNVAPVAAQDILPVPPHALPPDALIHAVVDHGGLQHLVIDGAALHRSAAVRAWASVNASAQASAGAALSAQRQTPAAPPGATAGARGASGVPAAGRTLICVALAPEMAVPIEMVQEIIPCPQDDALFGADSVLRGYAVLRGQSIALLCLSRLLGLPAPTAEQTRTACALLVQLGPDAAGRTGARIGLRVPGLSAIEVTHDEPSWPAHLGAGAGGTAARRLAVIGRGSAQRTVAVLDLVALVSALHGGAAAQNSTTPVVPVARSGAGEPQALLAQT